MQWAKPARDTSKWDDRLSEIAVNFQDPSDTSSASVHPDTSHKSPDADPSEPSSVQSSGTRSHWGSASTESDTARDHQLSSRQNIRNDGLQEDTAWNYYARAERNAPERYPDESQYRSTYSADDFYQIDDDTYLHDDSGQRGPQYNSATWNNDSYGTNDTGDTQFAQYALPLLVVAIIIFFAFLTLLL